MQGQDGLNDQNPGYEAAQSQIRLWTERGSDEAAISYPIAPPQPEPISIYGIGLPLNVQLVYKRAWDKTKRHISLQAENRIFIWKSGTPGIYGT
ncbi:hypothetical protein V2G26_010751 [Clonostachys chloroleuca]